MDRALIRLAAAALVGAALGAMLIQLPGLRYDYRPGPKGVILWRIDRVTGKVDTCYMGNGPDACAPVETVAEARPNFARAGTPIK